MGDTVFNGSHPYIDFESGSDISNWIALLLKLDKWKIKTVIPGHGDKTTKDILKKQAEYLIVLKSYVKKAIDEGLSLEEMKKSIKMEIYKDLKYPEFIPVIVEAVYRELSVKKENR